MKNKFTPFLLLIPSLILSSCALYVAPSTSSSSSEIPSSSEISSEPSSSSSSERVLKSSRVVETKDTFVIGEIYSEVNQIKMRNYYYDGSYDDVDLEKYSISSVREKGTSTLIDPTIPFAKGGIYEVFVSYDVEGKTKSAKVEITVLNGIEAGLSLVDFKLNEIHYVINKTFASTLDAMVFTATWENGAEEIFPYVGNEDLINISLFLDGNTKEQTNEKIKSESTYTIEAYLNNYEDIKYVETFTTPSSSGYYYLEQGDIIYEDFSVVTPHEGSAKMLVIPIEISATTPSNAGAIWDDDKLDYVYKLFFGEKEDTPNEWNSMRTYYDAASGGMVEIEGKISNVYRPAVSQYSIESCGASMGTLHKLFNSAIDYVKNNDSSINLDEYDRNDDGYIDNLHFITNVRVNNNDSPFWPHKYEIYKNNPGTLQSPNGYVYETTTYYFLEDSRTIIHEQGHMFGIPDYYDYSYKGADYVGALDMQSHNCFDWNSWSKFSVGWGKAYVIDGSLDSTEISIKTASLYNECLIIPANIETYNNSAFDEFFMLELFTEHGNNAFDFYRYFTTAQTKAGIRLYHVDARLFSYQYGEVSTKEDLEYIKSVNGHVDVGVNNSFDHKDYAVPGNAEWGDFKQLALIQKGAVDTFGDIKDGINTLQIKDLFLTGDKFTFDKYAHFLSKSGKEITTMDNGEIFPYEIEIVSITNEQAIIEVNKIA